MKSRPYLDKDREISWPYHIIKSNVLTVEFGVNEVENGLWQAVRVQVVVFAVVESGTSEDHGVCTAILRVVCPSS